MGTRGSLGVSKQLSTFVDGDCPTAFAFPRLPIALAFAFHVACPGLLVGRSWQRKLCWRVSECTSHISSRRARASGTLGLA